MQCLLKDWQSTSLRSIRKCLALLVTVSFVSAAAASANPTTCEVSHSRTKDGKALCVRAATILLPQPRLTPTQIANGPDFDPAHPDRSRFAYFTDADTISCYFRPHYVFERLKSRSLKFQCWHMTPDGAFFGHRGERIAVEHPSVVITSDRNGNRSASLLDTDDSGETHEIKPDRLKIKYLSAPTPLQDPVYNEVFTEVAATRILWLLGVPSDRVYPVGAASCIGCGRDPFRNHLATNKASLKDAPVVFNVVSASRRAPWEEIDTGGDATWDWRLTNRFYADGEWTHQQKVEYDVYRLALGLIHFFNAAPKQNRLVCAAWQPVTSPDAKVCARPLIFVHDLGSTFGGEKGMNPWSANPRGHFTSWRQHPVFRHLQNCELSEPLGGDRRVLKDAQDLMIQRMAVLDPTTVSSIFRIARFQLMDREQLQRLRAAGSTNVERAALDEWTTTFLERVDEIRNAEHCRID